MLTGIGTDIIEIERIKKACQNSRFLQRVFTPAEQQYCLKRTDPYPCLAARFAGKEAVLKALGTGLKGCRFTDVEIMPEYQGGAPKVRLFGGAEAAAMQRDICKILISLSHDRSRAVAFAAAINGEGDVV